MDPYRPVHVPAMVMLHPNVVYMPSLDRIVNTIVGYRYQLTPSGPTDLPMGFDLMTNTQMYGAVWLNDAQNLAGITSDTWKDVQDGLLDDFLGPAALYDNRPAQPPGVFGAGLPRVPRMGLGSGLLVVDPTTGRTLPRNLTEYGDGYRGEHNDGFDYKDATYENYTLMLAAGPHLLASNALWEYCFNHERVNLLGRCHPALPDHLYPEVHDRLVGFFGDPANPRNFSVRDFITRTIKELQGAPAPMPNNAVNPVAQAARPASVQRMPTSTPSRYGLSWGLPDPYPSLTTSAGPSRTGQGRTTSYTPSSLRQASNA